MKTVTKQENILNILLNTLVVGINIYFIHYQKLWYVIGVEVIWIAVSLYIIATSIRILVDSSFFKRRLIERNGERYQLIKEKVAHATYLMFSMILSALFSFAAGMYALQGTEIQVSLVALSIVLVAISISTNQIVRISYSKILLGV